MKSGLSPRSWLSIVPAASSSDESIDALKFVVTTYRNELVKAALARSDKLAVIDALTHGGMLYLAIDDVHERMRDSIDRHGRPVLLAFTSTSDLAARHPDDLFVAEPVTEVVDDALQEPFVGLVLNPAGPWMSLSHGELRGIRERLDA
jgi:hypothetical protein